MPVAIALVAQLLPLLPSIETGVEGIIAFIGSVRTAAKQTGEWTPAMESSFLDALLTANTKRAWMTDAQLAVSK